jgi:hypothetical protein
MGQTLLSWTHFRGTLEGPFWTLPEWLLRANDDGLASACVIERVFRF